ncbi:alpha/beta fold hydrolase [Kribbella sp. DT2]|uniref:alpha/beta fold hydrolase n=1 Tax=Kribbella sp. DT2 TaxID=3393427 RepID=UPI003CFA1599
MTLSISTPDGRIVGYSLYGDPDGVPVVFHVGTPSTRQRRPDVVRATADSGIRLLTFDRPGYAESTRQVGRRVADVAADVRLLADAQGWERFAVAGGSGGGPHALACAALMPERVVRCAVVGGIAPAPADGPEPTEEALRPGTEQTAREIMALIEAGGPEIPPGPNEPAGPPALEDPAAMARVRATFVDSHDGWIDDNLAFARDWGFALGAIAVPVSLWFGSAGERDRQQAAQLAAAIPSAETFEYVGGHIQNDTEYRRMLAWLSA